MAPSPPPETAGAPAQLTEHRELIEDALRSAVGRETSPLAAASRYVMGWEDEDGVPTANAGKRIRPALALLGAQALGGTPSDALPGAVAVELVHNFSLVHDEVQDHDAERHHRPTIWALMGEAQAINVGDFLYTRAVQALTDGAGDVARRMRALQVLNAAIAAMIAGQWQDIAFETMEAVSADDYRAMVAGKTGALLGAPLEIGAILAGAEADEAAVFGRWGAHVGLAFQAQDDYLGIWGDPNATGKSNTNDIERRKKTLPIVHGLANADAAGLIRRAYRPTGEAVPVADVVTALEQAGADKLCREEARAHTDAAEALLSGLPLDAAWRDTFRAVARYLVERSA